MEHSAAEDIDHTRPNRRSGWVRSLAGVGGDEAAERRQGSLGEHWLAAVFGIDVRALAALRIGLAWIVLIDLWNRSQFMVAHYTDVGVLPRAGKVLFFDQKGRGSQWWWSLHMWSGEAVGQIVLFAIAAVVAVCLMVGYRTRLATVITWLLLISLHNRNPLLLQGGDVLLRCVFFWAMFLPLGAVASVDRSRQRIRKVPATRILSGASMALLLQVAMMYLCTALEKADEVWTTDYSAVHYALSIDHFSKPLGTWLLQFPRFLALLTWLTVQLEYYGPLIAFCPFWTARVRLVMVPVFWIFHICLGATLALGLFPLIAIVAWLPFLPSVFWDRLMGRLRVPRWPREWIDRPRTTVGLLRSVIVLVLFVCVACWAASRLPNRSGKSKPWQISWVAKQSHPFVQLTRLDQYWKMFSPKPMIHDGWFEIRGTLCDGSLVNLWEPGSALPRSKPVTVSATMFGQRWRKYLVVIREKGYRHHRGYLREWLRWRWDRYFSDGNPAKRVRKVDIFVHVETTRESGQPPDTPRRVLLHNWIYPVSPD